jgi:signal transduction histidine kinase
LVIAATLLGVGLILPRVKPGGRGIMETAALHLSYGVFIFCLWFRDQLDMEATAYRMDQAFTAVETVSLISVWVSLFLLIRKKRSGVTATQLLQSGSPAVWGIYIALFTTLLWATISTWLSPLPLWSYEMIWIGTLLLLATRFPFRKLFEDCQSSGSPSDHFPTSRVASTGTQVLNHALKNKLVTMEMALTTLQAKKTGDPEIAQEIRLIDQSVQHMKHMVQRIRDRTKSVILQEQPHNIRAIVDACLEELKQVKRSGTTIAVDPHLSAVLLCDAAHVKEVLLNIITNSMEALGHREGYIRIYSGEGLPNGWFTLIIEDNGPGIPASSLNRLFEPYFTTKAGKTNFGLGLSYCYNVMRAGSGSIKINSKEKKGTSVVLGFHPKKVLVYPVLPSGH